MAIMAARNLGAVDRGKQSWEKARASKGGLGKWWRDEVNDLLGQN